MSKDKTSQNKIWYAPHEKEAYGESEIQAVVSCLNDGWLAGIGPRTVKFEEEISKCFGKKHGLFVNSGSSAILLGLCAIYIKEDICENLEVITPACTFSTTLAPIIQCGLKPVFCDVEIGTYVPSVELICEQITKKTRIILLPNLIGSKPDWAELRKRISCIGRQDIVLFEDSADTITFTQETDISTTSFYASHLITAGGTGGMVMFNDLKQHKRACMFRDWGRIGDNSEDIKTRFEFSIDGIPYDYKFLYGAVGYNMKCSEINAAFGLAQLARIDEIKEKRRNIFQRYLDNLKDVKELVLPINKNNQDWMAIPFMYKNRLELLTFLETNNVQTRVCFAGNVTRHPAYRQYLNEFKNSDRIMAEGFLLGSHHGMTLDNVDYVCDKMKLFINMERVN